MKLKRFEMRADADWLKALDDWRAQQPDLPARAEAIRRLVDTALKLPKKVEFQSKVTNPPIGRRPR
jgi:hypothetical protein